MKLVRENINDYLPSPSKENIKERIFKDIDNASLTKLMKTYRKIINHEYKDLEDLIIEKIRKKTEENIKNNEYPSNGIMVARRFGWYDLIKEAVPRDVYNMSQEVNGKIYITSGEENLVLADVSRRKFEDGVPVLKDFDRNDKVYVELSTDDLYAIETEDYWYFKYKSDWYRYSNETNIPPFVV